MAINTSGILKSPQGSAIQNAEIIFEQTRTSTEVLAGTKFSVITNQTGNYSSSLGVGTYVFKVRFQDETQYRTVASNVIVTQSMNNYSLNQIIQDQSQLQDVDYNLLQDVIQARDQAAASKQEAQSSQATASTKASEASSSAQAALASKNAAQTSEANALASKNAAQTSQTNAASSQTAAANSQATSTTKATEASNSAQAALTSKNAAQTSETNALASKNAAQTSQTNAANSQTGAATSQTTATTKAAQASASETQAQQSQSGAQDSAQQANTSASDAQSSQASASASQTTATTKATESSNSAQAALASKNAAQTSETNALASKNQAQSSQTNAASSQTAAAGSQTTASTKASQAATSQTQAQQSQSDAGAAASQADSSAQQAQQSQTSASTSQTTATTKASEASSSAQAALASKNAAQTSETNALSSKNAAQTSQTNAAGSQTAASTSQTTASTKAGEASTSQTNADASQTTATTKAGEASTSQTNAATSQATATTKAGEASTSQTNAASSQSTATTKATEATNSATLAQKWAANPENSVVSGGLYSALHYAAKAAQSAQTASGQLVWRGGWSAQAGVAPPAPTGSTQDFYRITQAGTILSVQYEIGDYIHWDTINSIWFKMDGTDSVVSVNGRTGAVVIAKADVGLSLVNNWGASSQTNDASTTTYATTAGVKAAYDLAATKLAATANAVSATKLVTARTINGTSFDGTANITTQNWGTARTLTIGNAAKSVNGDGNVSWSLDEIGAYHPGNKPSLGSDLGLQWQLPNPGGTSRYVRLVTLGLTDNDITFVLAGFGDHGTTKRATYNVTVATRVSGISVDVTALDVDWLYGAKPIIYHRRVGESFEVWVKTPSWNLDATFTRLSGRGGVVNIDSSTTTEPTGLTEVTINQIYTTRFKPTAGDVGAVSKTGDTMTGNLTAPAVLVSSTQNTSANALTRKDYVDSAIAAGDALQVSKAGDSMIGQLSLTPSFVDTNANAQLAHIGKDATKPLYIRNMREHISSVWLWEKVYNGSIYYSSGTNGSGTNRIRLQVSSSGGEIYLGTNADKRVYHEGFKPTASELAVVPDTRTVNGKRLNTDITITSEDVGAYNKQGQEDLVQASQLPFPDVWAPLSDNLRMLQGYGDDIAVGDYVVATQISFSRNSSATYIGKDGLLKTAAANEPRFEKEGLLIEGQSTNVFNVVAGASYNWLSSGLTQSAGTAQLPFDVFQKTITSSTFSPTNTGRLLADIYGILNPAASGGGPVTASLIMFGDADAILAAEPRMNITSNLPITGVTNSAVKLNSGMVRVMWTGIITAGSITNFPNFQVSWLNRLPSVVVGCYQVEALPFASSYIPTNGAAVTRAADVAKLPQARNIPDLLGSSYAIAAKFTLKPGVSKPYRFLFRTGNILTESMGIVQVNGGTKLKAYQGSAEPGNNFVLLPFVEGSSFVCGLGIRSGKVVAYSSVDRAVVANPRTFTPNSTQADFLLGDLRLMGNYQGSNEAWGHIRDLRIWWQELSDAQWKVVS